MKKIFGLVMALTLGAVGLRAQDARLSHPFLWKMYYNPAAVGAENMVEAALGAQTSYTQKPTLFMNNQLALSVPLRIKKSEWGVGLRGTNEYEGNGLMNTLGVGIPVAVRVYVAGNTYIQFGFEPDIQNRRVNKNKLLLGDQLDEYYGRVRGTSDELSGMKSSSLWACDMSLGLWGSTVVGRNAYQRPKYIEYGVGVAHVLGSNSQSFFGKDGEDMLGSNKYYRRWAAQAEYAQPIAGKTGRDVYVAGYGIYEQQGPMREIQVGGYTTFRQFALVGIGGKVEKYRSKYTVENLMIHLGSNIGRMQKALVRVAYTFEMPLTQGNTWQTSVHSLSVHCFFNTDASRFRCKWPSKVRQTLWKDW